MDHKLDESQEDDSTTFSNVNSSSLDENIADSKAIKDLILDILDEMKVEDVLCIDIREKSSVADYMIIASGTSQTHVGAIGEKTIEVLKKSRYVVPSSEGFSKCNWVLVDAGLVVIHIFIPAAREYYNLEGMWSPEAVS